MAAPIKLVETGGIPIINATGGPPLTPVEDPSPGAGPFQLVESGGALVTLVNADGSAWEAP